uniref:Polyprotein 1 n=1 Tax=Physostegia virginiana crinkle-associated virus 1 TaxID=3075965 RepID=A0AA95Z1W6_9VIRU|nr:polyprotein 1 [Physostegia virginiana crinkle-associated virus 1]
MDFECLKVQTKFLNEAAHLPAIEHMVRKCLKDESHYQVVMVFSTMFYAQSKAMQYNAGLTDEQLNCKEAILQRNAYLEHYLLRYRQGTYSFDQMIAYNQAAYNSWFGLDLTTFVERQRVQAAAEPSMALTFAQPPPRCIVGKRDVKVMLGQGLFSFIAKAPDMIGRFVHGACTNTFAFIMDCFKQAFEKCFGGFFQRLSTMLTWIKDMYDLVVKWAQSASERLVVLCGGLEDMLCMGLGLTTLTCMVAILERFLVAAGVLSGSVGAPMLFLTAAIGTICAVQGGLGVISNCTAQLIAFSTESCKYVLSEMGFKRRDELPSAMQQEFKEGQFAMSAVLENMASLTASWSEASVIEVGKTFSALTQIKNGIISMKDMSCYVFTKFGDFVHKYLGFESMVLADLSVVLGQNLVVWLEECDAIVSYMVDFKSGSRDVLDRLSQLITKGTAMRNGVLSSNHRGSVQVLSAINKALDKLKELQTAAIMTGSNRTRKCPFMVFVTGGAGKGKTSLAQKLVTTWLTQENLDASEWYSRNGQDHFWSGYHRQAAVSYDDFGAVAGKNSGGISNEAEIIGVVSRNPLALNMASLEEKGMHFDSNLIVASSNFKAANAESGVHDADAYERRRHVMIEVDIKEEVDYNPEDFTQNQRYTILESKSPFREVCSFETFAELWSYIYTKYSNHMAEENKFLASLQITETTHKEAFSALLSASAFFDATAPAKILNMIRTEYKGYLYFFYQKGKVYLWNPQEGLKIVSTLPHLTSDEIAFMEEGSLRAALRLQDMAKGHPLINPLAVHYIGSFIKYGWIGEDLQPTKACDDEFTRKQIQALPDWQRAYLYVISESLKGQDKKGWFSAQLVALKREMRYLYLKEFRDWPIALKVAVGCLLAVLVGGSAYSLVKSLWNLGTGPAFVAGAAVMVKTGESNDTHGQRSDYVFRNIRVQQRKWEGQACFGDGDTWLADQCCALLRYCDATLLVCILPGGGFAGVAHALLKIRKGALISLELKGAQTVWVCWEPEKLQLHEGNELATYFTNTLPQTCNSLKDRIVYDVEKLPKTFKASFFTYGISPISGNVVATVGGITAHIAEETLVVVDGEYSRKVPKSIKYAANTIKGDCGSLVIATIDGKAQLVGIHVAGNGKEGSACFVPYVPFVDIKQGQDNFGKCFEEWTYPEVYGSGCSAVGIMKQEYRIRTTSKSSLKQTPTDWHLDTPCDKQPAILSGTDERLQGTRHAGFNVYKKGMEKYANEAGPFETDTLDLVCDEIAEEWMDASSEFTFEEVPMEVALNGLENVEYFDSVSLQTSEGFPYILDRQPGEKGKYRYISGDVGHMEICDQRMRDDCELIDKISSQAVPELVCIECPKDERLPLRKVLIEPKTRLFSVLPMSYNLVVRRKFLNFVRFIMMNRRRFPCQVGVNPYSREWGDIAQRLLSKGDTILCCDYSRFDGFLPKLVMQRIARMINKLCGGTKELCASRENLLMACCSRYAICDKVVYRVENGIPSGFPMTVIVNSLFNEVLIRYAYAECFKDTPLIARSFNNFVSFVTYGDDNLISVSATIAGQFNGDFLKTFMAKLGIVITDGVDKTLPTLAFRSIYECDFLKRGFVQDRYGIWHGPMNKESLWPQLHFVRSTELEMHEAYVTNLNSVLRELFCINRDEAHQLRRKALFTLKWLDPSCVLTIPQIEAFYEEQLGVKYDYLTSVQKLMHIELMAPLRPGALPIDTLQLMANVYAACEHNFQGDLKNYFVISIGTNRPLGEDDGMVLAFTMGKGRGGLPTKDFLIRTLMRKDSAVNKKLHQAFEGEKPLLFISKDTSLVAMIMAIMFLLSRGKISKADCNVNLSKAINACKAFKFLTQEMDCLFI